MDKWLKNNLIILQNILQTILIDNREQIIYIDININKNFNVI